MNKEYTQNRELSWLRFNERVLMEATDESVPLLERLKFVSIFTSNLDEFFMVRVGSLTELMSLKESRIDNKSGMSIEEQLTAVYNEVHNLYNIREEIYSSLEGELRKYNIANLSYKELSSDEKKKVRKFYLDIIEPVLAPQIVDTHHPFPHLANKVAHIAASLTYRKKKLFGIIPMPQTVPSVFFLGEGSTRFIRTEEIVSAFIEEIYHNYSVEEKFYFCITRNADINAGDESFDFGYDFRKKMKRLVKERRRLEPVRLEVSRKVSGDALAFLMEKLGLEKHQVYRTKMPFKLSYAFDLEKRLSRSQKEALTYEPFSPQKNPAVLEEQSMIKQIEEGDILLSLPFESLDPFLRLIKEAADDPDTIMIKITIYRLASQAKIVDYLCRAAENGKDVTVLIELRARFDEQNNIDWSEKLEAAGCKIIYGFEEYKVHSKICQITRIEKGKIRNITQIGTGNYNEKTASQYTDISIMTANEDIGRDCSEFFKNMAIGNLKGQYKAILSSPYALKNRVIAMINEEIAKGDEGYIFLKMNSVTDLDIIKKLKEASCAGVKIEMVIRGICCILPEIPGATENIRIKSIVGRYLEHSRIYVFGKGDEERMYISSADFMTRNTERRVEVACPVLDPKCKDKINNIIYTCLKDNAKGRQLQSDGTYREILEDGKKGEINSQEILMEQAKSMAKSAPGEVKKKHGIIESIKKLFLH